MGRGLLIYVLAFGVFMSVLTSGPSEPFSTDGVKPVGASESYSSSTRDIYAASSSGSTGSGDEIKLDRSSDGHFYAEVNVNGEPIRFLVDTGASGIALSRDDARRARIATSISMPQVIGEGASGAVYGEVVTLERVSLGSKESTDVGAIVLDTGSQSLLGQSFLSTFASVEIRGDTMVLR